MLEALLEYRTDGLILVSPRLNGSEIAADVGTLPCVVIGRRVRSTQIDCVMTDEALGSHQAVEHLVGLGHERIVHIDGGQGAGVGAAARGYLRAMADAGLSASRRSSPATSPSRPAWRRPSGCCARATCRPRCSPPTTSSRSG